MLTQIVWDVPSVPAKQLGLPENYPEDCVPRAHVKGDGGIIVEAYENINFINPKTISY